MTGPTPTSRTHSTGNGTAICTGTGGFPSRSKATSGRDRFIGWYERRAERSTLVEEREATAAGLFEHDETAIQRIKPEELRGLLDTEKPPPLILDVRSPPSYERDGGQIPGSVRVPPDRLLKWDSGDVRDRLIVAYCT